MVDGACCAAVGNASSNASGAIHCYRAYGLGIASNVPLKGLTALDRPERIDVQLTLGELPTPGASADWEHYYRSPQLDTSGHPQVVVARSVKQRLYRVTYSDNTTITLDEAGTHVWAVWDPRATLEDTATYLLGPTLGFVLRLRGVPCLHASAVVIDDSVVAFVGASGAGKSSTAAAFAKLGFPVVTDDVLAVVERAGVFQVEPAYPRVRLWGEATRSLFGAENALPLITPNWNKRFLDLNSPGFRFQPQPLPLAVIYLLGGAPIATQRAWACACEPRDALIALVSNVYTSYLATPPMQAHELRFAARLLPQVNVRRLALPDLDSPQLCEDVIADFRAAKSQKAT